MAVNFRSSFCCFLQRCLVLLLGLCLGAGAARSADDAACAPSALPAAPSASAASAAAPAAPAVPLYRSQLPAPTTLHYLLRRSWLSGVGELRWARNAEAGYTLSLEGSLAGVRALSQTSSGTVDASGLVPQRFTDQRAKGSAHAAMFQRDKALIAFAGMAQEVPWMAGVQDRLSWMVQLPAIVRAEPARQAPGQSVELYVVGARGDADVWTFCFVGMEAVRTAGAQWQAAKWVREPRKPRDTSVEVWLAPEVQHLPVRARLGSSGGDGDAWELLLQRSSTP